MKKLFLLAIGAGFAIALLMIATPSMAVHRGSGDLTCGGCHTMHSSQGGQYSPGMGGQTGSLVLLRQGITTRANIHLLCLQCHSQNGAQAGVAQAPHNTTAPKVHLSPAWAGGAYSGVGAGGDFGTTGTYAGGVWTLQSSGSDWSDTVVGLGRGHSLGLETVIPPGNNTSGESGTGTAIAYLTCTSCHDSHGTPTTTEGINRFRNLRAGTYMQANVQNPWSNMNTFGDVANSYVGGVAGGTGFSNGTNPNAPNTDNMWPVWRSTGTQNVYYQKAVSVTLGGTSDAGENSTNVGISAFCAQCHGAWHEGRFPANRAGAGPNYDWMRHPVNNRIVDVDSRSGSNVAITAWSHYNNNTDSKGPYTSTDATKLPTAHQTAGGGTTYYATTSDGKVFCVSCHFSHGGPYNDILKWNYTSAVSSGSQTGNAIPSNIGCQQCHNR